MSASLDSPELLQLKLLFFEVLKRPPTAEEIEEYEPFIDLTSETTLQESRFAVQSALEDTIEYKKLVGEYGGTLTYQSSSYELSVSDIYSGAYKGVTLANGKIAMVTSPTYNDMDKTFITTLFDFNTFGTYTNNVTETYKYTRTWLHSRAEADTVVTNMTQTLNMHTGSFRVRYDAELTKLEGSPTVHVKHDILPLRQYPYCVYHAIEINADSELTFDFYHDLITPEHIIDVRYVNNVIMKQSQGVRTPVLMFGANGRLKEIDKPISSLTAYMFDDQEAYVSKGYNINRLNYNEAFNKFEVYLYPSTTNPGTFTYKMYMITCTMTQYDFDHPDMETQRILINVVNKTPQAIVTENAKEWSRMWSTDIVVTEKSTITDEAELQNVNHIRKFIKFSLYNIYAMIRDDVNVEINPLNLSTIDLNGHIFWSAELWLIPVLLFIKPKAARTLLDYRFTQLEKAKKLASAHGYKGTRFAYEGDTMGYTDVYWDTVSPLYVFNTALVAISAWNYYRVVRDVDWLRKKGYEIIKNAAEFFMSKLEYDTTDQMYHMYSVVGMNSATSDDNALSNYLAMMTIKYAMEATFELNYIIDVAWREVVNKIYIPVIQSVESEGNTYLNIIKADAGYTGESLQFLEPLIILMPYFSRDFFTMFPELQMLQTIKDNLAYYTTKMDEKFENNAINDLIIGTTYANLAQQEPTYHMRNHTSLLYLDQLNNVMDNATIQPWHTFFNSINRKAYNDVSVSALYLLSLITGCAGIRVLGGINEARFYYEEFGIRSRTANVMPKYWQSLELRGIGHKQQKFTITNAMFYPTPIY
jgi:hypothetical protein